MNWGREGGREEEEGEREGEGEGEGGSETHKVVCVHEISLKDNARRVFSLEVIPAVVKVCLTHSFIIGRVQSSSGCLCLLFGGLCWIRFEI